MGTMRTQIILLLCLAAAASVKCYKLLVLFPVPGPSHYFLGNALAKGLAEAGHDVTMIGAFSEKNPPKNGKYKEIVLAESTQMRRNGTTNFFNFEKAYSLQMIMMMDSIGTMLTNITLEHQKVKDLINSNEKFDAVIIEQFLNEAFKGFAYRFNAPLIMFSTIGATKWVNYLVGNPSPPSYVPGIFTSYSAEMTFWQRFINTFESILTDLYNHFISFPNHEKMMKKAFPDAPDLSTLMYNTSLVLLNSHESSNGPVPLVPNMINIGGYHINPVQNKLSKDLEQYLENAPDGVVYFSMGSNIQPSLMENKTKRIITKALGRLKQKVLWKWDEDVLEGQPENVKIMKWVPQQDVLAHRNIKLFITHGGLLSTLETIYHGVPVLALPVYGDQKMNSARAQSDGYGLSLSFSKLTEEILFESIIQLINNPKYRDNAKLRSSLMRDRPMKPMDIATYWIEFVIRHRGAPHLRVAGLNLPWYKYLLLDIAIFTVIMVVVIILSSYLLCQAICCRIGKKNKGKLKAN